MWPGQRPCARRWNNISVEPGERCILGMLQDKDWRHICETLAPLAARIFTAPVSSERSADAGELAAACRAVNPAAGIAACGSLRAALEKTADDDFVVVTGSLYLVGEALELAGLSPATSGERALNEWTGRSFPVLIIWFSINDSLQHGWILS